MADLDLQKIAADETAKQAAFGCRIFCCNNTSCKSGGGESVIDALKASIEEGGLKEQVQIVPAGCMGLCAQGPLIRVEVKGQKPVLYKTITPMVARLVVADHVAKALAAGEGEEFKLSPSLAEHTLSLDLPFFAKQTKVVLKNLGTVDPENIDDYISHGGYEGLKKALSLKPEEVIEEVKKSGLRGRGGGGFPTGVKWGFARKSQGVTAKYIICNGDEGDPGAYMDSGLLEGDPHSVLEGMIIGAYAIGATFGWFYIRAEYPLAVERITKAIQQAKRKGLLGKNIMGSGFDFDCDVRLGAGAFVCGEETALIASLEGKRGTPRPRPPYPTDHGLWGEPSCINNVETFANVPRVMALGAAEYSKYGSEKSKGTKVFALTGRVQNGGLVEVPLGMKLIDIVEQVGGGVANGKKIKAVQTGGPSGGVIPRDKMDVPVCYDTLKELGSIMGSGGMIVMDEDDSMVDISCFYLGFSVDESCGKCAPCRIGGTQMLGLLKKIAKGDGTQDDIEALKCLAQAVKSASLCGLGQTTPNPVLSTLRYFEDEYRARLKKPDAEKTARAGE